MYVADILIYIQNLHARKIKKEPASLAPENFADRAGISLNRTNICVLANHAGKYLRRNLHLFDGHGWPTDQVRPMYKDDWNKPINYDRK